MTTEQVKLTEQEINEQKQYAQKYLDLINKELGYGNLVNLKNVEKYTKAYKSCLQLADLGYIEMPVFA